MSNKLIFIIITSFIIVITSFFVYKMRRKIIKKEKIEENIRVLPELKFDFYTDLKIKNNRPVIISLIEPDCEHCQYMVSNIVNNKKSFEKIEMVIISTSNKNLMNSFIRDYKLNTLKNLIIGLDTNYTFYNTFGVMTTPSFFVYNKKHILVKSIKGETKIENLLTIE